MSEANRLDRLEALAETILLAVQQQQQLINDSRQEWQDNISDVVQMVSDLAHSAEQDREVIKEMQSEVKGLQSENRRILDYLINGDRP